MTLNTQQLLQLRLKKSSHPARKGAEDLEKHYPDDTGVTDTRPALQCPNNTTKSVNSNPLDSPWFKRLRTMWGWRLFLEEMWHLGFSFPSCNFYIWSHFVGLGKGFLPPSLLPFSYPLSFLPSFPPSPLHPCQPFFSLFMITYPPSLYEGICNIQEDQWLWFFFSFFPVGDWGNQRLFTIITLHVCTHLWQG